MEFGSPGFEDYLEAILWVSEMDDLSIEDFSSEAIGILGDYYDRFCKSINVLGLKDYYTQAYGIAQLGHDFALEQLGSGCGFMDRYLLEKSNRDLFCEIADKFPKFGIYESEEGKVEVE